MAWRTEPSTTLERRDCMFSLLAAAISAPLAQLAEGALLAATVYAASRSKDRR